MWRIDIRHCLIEQQDDPAAPQLAAEGEKKMAEIITWITSRARGLPVGEAPKCWRRPKKKSVQGYLENPI
jgi:hypothetical protein